MIRGDYNAKGELLLKEGTTEILKATATGVAFGGTVDVTGKTTAANLDVSGTAALTTGQAVVGSRFAVTALLASAASVGVPIFTAPFKCKIVEAYETHVTACDAADTLTIEKCTSGEAPGAGDVALAAAWAMNSAPNTPVKKAAVADGKEALAVGDSLMLKIASGDGTTYANGCVTVLLQVTA